MTNKQFNAIYAVKNSSVLDGLKVEEYSVNDYMQKERWYDMWSDMALTGKKQALYFLYDDVELVYIGQTGSNGINNPYKRPIAHLTCERSPKKYNKIKIFHVPDEICLDTLESIFIFKHKPKYNKYKKIGGAPLTRFALAKLMKQFEITIKD